MFFWKAPQRVGEHHESNSDKREEICSRIDDNGFDWQIWAVASSGFFTDSYNLFATNVILPSLAFVYWSGDSVSINSGDSIAIATNYETAINEVTLVGSLLGQLIFGYLSDRFGRKRLYGVELVIVIFGTIGFVQSGSGYNQESMSIIGWIIFWRFFVGLGIGAEYPLSAVITAEFAPRQSRARMMASVFIMQPLGQLLASAVGLAVLVTIGSNLPNVATQAEAAIIVDKIWRTIIGVGAFPAFVAIIFRLTIPESPRYTLDVDHDGTRALQDTRQYLNLGQGTSRRRSNIVGANNHEDIENRAANANVNGVRLLALPEAAITQTSTTDDIEDQTRDPRGTDESDESDEESDEEDRELPDPFSRPELKRYFITEGNIKYLLGTSIAWFLLDFAFFGLGINNPRVLAEIWSSNYVNSTATPGWSNPSDPDLSDSTQPGWSIYETLERDGIRSIITISVGSLLGSIVIIKLINYVPRKAWLAWSFVSMAILFAIAGGTYFAAANSDMHALTIVFYVLAQLLFNLGPNTLTFIIPAEIFPTRYRGTCHGISAASGKLGSVIVQAFLTKTHISDADSKSLCWVLLGFSVAMASGAFFVWAWIPEVQNPRDSEPEDERRSSRRRGLKRYEVPTKSLEELAGGRKEAEDGGDDGLKIGFRFRSRLHAKRLTNAVRNRRKTG